MHKPFKWDNKIDPFPAFSLQLSEDVKILYKNYMKAYMSRDPEKNSSTIITYQVRPR